jgi:site-specific DNA recombinase
VVEIIADAERAAGALDRLGPSIAAGAENLRQPGRRRTENGGYRRNHLRALAQRVEVDVKEVRIMGSKSVSLRALVAASSEK